MNIMSPRNDAETLDDETKLVARWLEAAPVRPAVVRLTRVWDDLDLLGIDLADQLEALVRGRQRHAPINFDLVDWGLLAERYAYEICGVTEEELTRRRVAAGGAP